MALFKERVRHAQGIDSSSLEFFGSDGHHPTLFDSSNSSSFGFANSLPHQAQPSLVHWAYSSSSSSSVLSFEQSKMDQEEECALWIEGMDREYRSSRGNSRLGRDTEERFGLLYPNTTGMDSLQDGGEMERGSTKRTYMGGDNMLASKKQCGNNRKAKAKLSPSKDPQSVAAKNRRERISERLKILQDLVPNGTKVDLVTMLEKAISYVKFLQLQVKVLATDEFWPAQGGKAPEVSQVKEAIDAILSSHRDRSSTSKQ